MLGWLLLAGGVALGALGLGVALTLYPPLPRDLGGAPDLDREARPVPVAVPGDGALDAWLIAGSRPAAVALFHGYGRTHHRLWRYASFLRRLGLHLVAVDFRSARAAARRPTTLGVHERRDVEAVLDWMLEAPELAGCRIGFFGESLGGSVALSVAASRPEVAAVVADGAFATSARAIEDSCRRWARIPGRLVPALLRDLGRRWTGHNPGGFRPVDDAHALAGRPVLFIHADRDARLGADQAHALWRAAGSSDPLWVVPRAGHNQGWMCAREEYERRVSAFFARHLLGEGPGALAGVT